MSRKKHILAAASIAAAAFLSLAPPVMAQDLFGDAGSAPLPAGMSLDEYANVPTGLLLPPDQNTIEEKPQDGLQEIKNNLPYSKIVELYRDKKYAEIIPSLELLASNKHHGAEELLGIMHQMGQGVPRDPAKGYSLIYRAAEAGRALALHHMAVMTYTGNGVEEDHMRALMWIHIALAYYTDGPEKQRAISDRKTIYKNLSRRQKEAAIQQAREWLDKRGEAHLIDPNNIEP